MTDFPIEWTASLIAITTSTFRAFNLGYQAESYFMSIFTYIVFMIYAEKKSQKILNVFYILTALVGVYRYGDIQISQEFLIKITPFIIVVFALLFSLTILHISKKLVKIHTKKNQ